MEQNLPEAENTDSLSLVDFQHFFLFTSVTFLWKVLFYWKWKRTLSYILGPEGGVYHCPLGSWVCWLRGQVCPSLSSAHPVLSFSEISPKNVSWSLLLTHMRCFPEPDSCSFMLRQLSSGQQMELWKHRDCSRNSPLSQNSKDGWALGLCSFREARCDLVLMSIWVGNNTCPG